MQRHLFVFVCFYLSIYLSIYLYIIYLIILKRKRAVWQTAWKKIKTPSGKLLTLSQEPLTQISIRMRERQRGIISHQHVLLGVSCYHWALILRDDVKQHDHWPNTTVGIKMSACVCCRGNCAAALWGDWTERERQIQQFRRHNHDSPEHCTNCFSLQLLAHR